ncbi:MAG TPA: hypothetical protein VMA74_03570 [Dyella sp.]|uniref:lysozyme inhibitor LprI family protein n=1 Tax=Dyella sp. TaxID=1869338 RepID=UPI002BDCBDFA|nr:hypothetical protein [Dyella sp.]HUB88788.1 hypothetical protein [Dyella sp.]
MDACEHGHPSLCRCHLPAALIGQWQVAEVHINSFVSSSENYHWNDGRLRWRIFHFSNQQITDDTSYGNDTDECDAPQASVARMSLQKLMSGSLAHGYGDAPDAQPSPEAYKLPAEPNQQVDVVSIRCQDGLWQSDLGVGDGVKGAWMYLAPGGQLILRWGDETILVLDRLPADAKPQPSFDCAKADSPICRSLHLASFDRSVAWSYKVARDDIKDTDDSPAKFVAEQHAWLHKRDACGADASCLLKTMEQRLDELARYP